MVHAISDGYMAIDLLVLAIYPGSMLSTVLRWPFKK